MKFKCENKSDNDVISMAEMIICDEESTRVARLQGSIIQLLEAYKYKFVNYQVRYLIKNPFIILNCQVTNIKKKLFFSLLNLK